MAATHVNNQQKTLINLQWTAPPAGTGPINFWYSYVHMHYIITLLVLCVEF